MFANTCADVQITQRHNGLSVRIERQNLRGSYVWMMCLSTVMFALFCNTIYGASLRHPHDAFYFLPVFALGLTCYVLVVTIALWGIFGVEEIVTEAGSLRWTRSILKWNRTSNIPAADITDIRAITPWFGVDNSVEVTAAGKQQRIGDKLLHDEAIELAYHLRRAIGLTR
jgi:hypothetical protein